MNVSSKYRDFDYIKTKDGVVFIVNSAIHPKNKIRASVVYFPRSDGNRVDRKTGRKYIKKIEEAPSADSLILKIHPEYFPGKEEVIRNCFLVPINQVVEHYKPRHFLKECLKKNILGDSRWKKLILAIDKIANVPLNDIGIYGSLLVGLNKDVSDVDIVIYGQNNLEKFRDNFELLLANTGIKKASRKQRIAKIIKWKKIAKNNPKYSPIEFDKLQRIESRRWSRICVYGDDITSIRFAYNDDEIPQEVITSPVIKEVRICGKVVDSIRTHFCPKVAKVAVDNRILEVITYNFLFLSCVFDKDEVEIFGNYRKDGQREYITLDEPSHYICPTRINSLSGSLFRF